MPADEQIRALERSIEEGDETALERYLALKVRLSPNLVHKLVRRVIRLERAVVLARVNEEQYFTPVTTKDFIEFLDKEVPDRGRGVGRLVVEGELPETENGHAGGRAIVSGGRASGNGNAELAVPQPPTNAELHQMILALTERVAVLEAR